MKITEALPGGLFDICSIMVMLAFINITYKYRYAKAAQQYVKEQLELFASNGVACVISLYLYYFVESNFHIDRDHAGGILLVLFFLLSGVGGKWLYQFLFQKKQKRFCPTKEEYLVMTSAVFIVVAFRLVSKGIVPLAVPCALLLGRFIWMDTTSLKEIKEAVAVQHTRIIESAILLVAGMFLLSIVMSVFQLPLEVQPLLAVLCGLIILYPVEILKAALSKIYQCVAKKKDNR